MKQRGFTLIEILTVVAVFSIIILIATNIFLIATSSQRRAADAQRTQGDIRFAMEAMAREVRYGSIDYPCYESDDAYDDNCTPDGAPVLDPGTHRTDVLAVIDSEGKRIRFRTALDELGTTRLLICTIDIAANPADPLDKCKFLFDSEGRQTWDAVTPIGVNVVRATFYITPDKDPFALCDDCAAGRAYEVDEQPHATIILQTRQNAEDAFPEQVSMQTTVTSHVYGR